MMVIIIIITIITLLANNYLEYKITKTDGNRIYHRNSDVISLFLIFFLYIPFYIFLIQLHIINIFTLLAANYLQYKMTNIDDTTIFYRK